MSTQEAGHDYLRRIAAPPLQYHRYLHRYIYLHGQISKQETYLCTKARGTLSKHHEKSSTTCGGLVPVSSADEKCVSPLGVSMTCIVVSHALNSSISCMRRSRRPVICYCRTPSPGRTMQEDTGVRVGVCWCVGAIRDEYLYRCAEGRVYR